MTTICSGLILITEHAYRLRFPEHDAPARIR